MKKRGISAIITAVLLACVLLSSCAQSPEESHSQAVSYAKELKNYEAEAVSYIRLEAVSIEDFNNVLDMSGDIDGTIYRVNYKTDGKSAYYSTSRGVKVHLIDGVMYELDESNGSKTKHKVTAEECENYRKSLLPTLLKYELPESVFQGIEPTKESNGNLTYTVSISAEEYYQITNQEVVSHVEFSYTVNKNGELVSAIQATNSQQNGFVTGKVESITFKNAEGVKTITAPEDTAEYK